MPWAPPMTWRSPVLGKIDLEDLLSRMANRDKARSEATLQRELHAFLLAAPLALHERDIDDQKITLEQQAGERRLIDVEVGFCVFEVKRDLRVGRTLRSAEEQLAGYVRSRTEAMGQRYVGILTDGADWHLYHLDEITLRRVDTFCVDSAKPDVDGLSIWLESVLSTATSLKPSPQEIELRLGARSAGHALDYAEISNLYVEHRDLPTVKLKRELWARLLTTAYGTGFTDTDELFIEHSLLVVIAEIIAHCVIGLDPTSPDVSAEAIVTGEIFTSAEVHGVVEADFFDWLIEVEGGDRFIKALARRLSRFTWRAVEHDVLKTLYESIISTEQRKQLGEYYTPDWLADRIVDATVTHPLEQRVLDPACGSGTFLFHAVRRYLAAADAKKQPNAIALEGLTRRVLGMDLHPVAVTFARVTYLLAIGPDRLQADDRPPIAIPVYLGDSIQWGQERTLLTANALVIPTSGAMLVTHDLRFPTKTLADAGQFDRLVAELTDLAKKRRSRSTLPSLRPIFKRYGIEPNDQEVLSETFKTLCELHDAGRNHIWGYYVRNLARPVWLSRPENRVDVLVGNPPWLSYRFMTATMQNQFKQLSKERELWAGAAVATNQDLSALFVLRSIERYLDDEGTFGFVMPWSALRSRQFAGFRSAKYPLPNDARGLTLAFGQAWDLHAVKPVFFPVPASVVFGQRTAKPTALEAEVEKWSGKLKQTNVAWAAASKLITRQPANIRKASKAERDAMARQLPYLSRFTQGAIVVPRVLFVVEKQSPGPLGASAGRISVASRRTTSEKPPWKSVPTMRGKVERQFVRPMHLGETLLPYRLFTPLRVVIPWSNKRLLECGDEDLSTYPGLLDWWTKAEHTWTQYRKSTKLSLKQQLDYQQKLTLQLPTAPYRIVYNKSGMYLAAAIVTDGSIIDHTLYWGTCATLDEARYLEAVFNSDALTQRVRPLQARGQHNPRHYDKYVLQVPIPLFDPGNKRHRRLVALAEEAELLAAQIELPEGQRFEALRRMVRQMIAASKIGRHIETNVDALLM